MRKFVIAAALAASALSAAAPAAAQWAPPPPGYGYGQPQGYGYGYNNYGQVRRLDARIDNLQRQINNLDRRNILSEREAARLRYESNMLERRLHFAARNGLSSWEARDVERGIYRLEIRIQREARDDNRWGNGYNRYPYGGYDRDRDGLDDRYERDHGRDYDEDHDRD